MFEVYLLFGLPAIINLLVVALKVYTHNILWREYYEKFAAAASDRQYQTDIEAPSKKLTYLNVVLMVGLAVCPFVSIVVTFCHFFCGLYILGAELDRPII